MENRIPKEGGTPKEKLLAIVNGLSDEEAEQILQSLSSLPDKQIINNTELAKYLDTIIKEDANLLKRLAQ